MQYDLIAGWLGLWSEELNLSSLLLRVALSGLFAAIIGCERSSKRHSAGLRTFIIVSIAGVAAMLIDQWLMSFSGASLPILSAATALSMATISGIFGAQAPRDTPVSIPRISARTRPSVLQIQRARPCVSMLTL